MFGLPFHCIIVCVAEQLRLASGRSIAAEHADQYFNKLRQKTPRKFNCLASNIIGNEMLRLSVERQKADLAPNETFTQQDQEIQQMMSESSEMLSKEKHHLS